jgi:L-threonylcarbamoyladenylate synthase
LELIRRVGIPLATTSANRSGGMEPKSAKDVLNDLDGRIELLLDGGAAPGGVPSTVVDLTTNPPQILRQGAILKEDLEKVLNITLK